MLDIEIVKQCSIIVLGSKARILQVSLYLSPVLYATIVKKAQVFGNNKWYNPSLQALPEHHQSAYTTVAILKWVNALKLHVKIQYVRKLNFLNTIIFCK